MFLRIAIFALSLLAWAPDFQAQSQMVPMKLRPEARGSAVFQPVASPQCQSGVVYDDGMAENGITFDVSMLDMVQRFDGVGGLRVDQICICWTRLPGLADIDFDLVFYRADGPGGQPGTFIASFPATAAGVPLFPDVGLFGIDLASFDLILPPGDIYVGAFWLARSFDNMFLCTDEDGGGVQPIFASGDLGLNWSDVRLVDPTLDALMIRGDFTDPALASFEIPTLETLGLLTLALLLGAAAFWRLRG
jgi:hypothetical protein